MSWHPKKQHEQSNFVVVATAKAISSAVAVAAFSATKFTHV
jgi:hypothetical protein